MKKDVTSQNIKFARKALPAEAKRLNESSDSAPEWKCTEHGSASAVRSKEYPTGLCWGTLKLDAKKRQPGICRWEKTSKS